MRWSCSSSPQVRYSCAKVSFRGPWFVAHPPTAGQRRSGSNHPNRLAQLSACSLSIAFAQNGCFGDVMDPSPRTRDQFFSFSFQT